MSNRREFLQTAAIVAAVPIVARTGLASDAPGDHLIVFDERFAASRRFGARAAAAHWSVYAINGDVTSLWQKVLSRRWAGRPVPVAGLTDRAALFCLERLAWDYRMRVVYHVEHQAQANGKMTHSERIPADGVGVSEFAAAGESWPEFTADALAGLPTRDRKARGPSEASMAAAFGEDESVLHSWVIAPVFPASRSSAIVL